MNEQVKSDLASADPVVDSKDVKLRALMRRVAADARAVTDAGRRRPATGGRVPWWKRRRALIPIGLGTLVAITGAAVLIPLQLRVNDTLVDLDAEIPIIYTTDTGVDVSCRYGFYFGVPADRTDADEELADFVQTHDWTGIGQRIYDEAIANPFVPGPNDDFEVDTQEIRDMFSFNNATSTVIWEEIPEELLQEGQSSGSPSDCKGQLR